MYLVMCLLLVGDNAFDNPSMDLRILVEGTTAQRMHAARRLGEKRDHRAVALLIKSLSDPNLYVRGWAAWALGEIGDPVALPALNQVIAKYKLLIAKDGF